MSSSQLEPSVGACEVMVTRGLPARHPVGLAGVTHHPRGLTPHTSHLTQHLSPFNVKFHYLTHLLTPHTALTPHHAPHTTFILSPHLTPTHLYDHIKHLQIKRPNLTIDICSGPAGPGPAAPQGNAGRGNRRNHRSHRSEATGR